MREENYGPVVNPDGTPTETTLEIMGFKRRVGDTFEWLDRDTFPREMVIIIALTASGVVVNYVNNPIEEDWIITYDEAM